MANEPKKSTGDNNWHVPLPYVVRLRVVIDQDKPPTTHEAHVIAYSLYEALMQALLEASGRADASDYKVEHIGPDLPGYLRMAADLAKAAIQQG